MKLKEIILMTIITIFTNWFLLKMLTMHGTIIKPTEYTWILGFFTGTMATQLLNQFFKYFGDKI